MLKAKDHAPEFTTQGADGKIHSLSDYKGKKIALYFYPKDLTYGCTKQACNLRDHFSLLKEKGIAVLGVSGGTRDEQAAFKKKHSLPFPLLYDEGKAISKAYNVYGWHRILGLIPYKGIKRTTFLIDEEGKIVHIFSNPNIFSHAEEIIERFDQSSSNRFVLTHSGPFHADEIVAIVQLVLAGRVDLDKVIRSRDPKFINQVDYVVDVGGYYDPKRHLFDHHQEEYTGPFSSAGMVGKFLYDEGVYDEQTYQFLKSRLLDQIDAFDNGRVSSEILQVETFSSIIESFVPFDEELSEEKMNAAFSQALYFAKGHIERKLNRFSYQRQSLDYVKEVMNQSKYLLIFDRYVPWLENFFALGGDKHPGLFVLMPGKEGWKLRVIPKSYEERMGARLSLPQSWAGKMDEEFEKITQIKGSVFCHKGQFIAFFRTKEGAIKAAWQVLHDNNLQ